MTRVSWLSFETWLFPMTVFSFLGPSVRYVVQVFDQNLRWGLLALLIIYVLVRVRVFSVFRGNLGLSLLLLLGWALATTLWSIVPTLSFAKSIAFLFVAVGLLGAGQYWGLRYGPAQSLDYLLPLVLLAMFAAALGPSLATDGGAVDTGGSVSLYRGLSGNPNMLGSLMAMTVPALLWRLYQEPRTQWRWLWMLAIGGILLSLLLANSRAALIVALTTGLGMLLTLSVRRRQMVMLVIAFSVLAVLLAAPALLDVTVDRYVYKGATQDQGALFTREQVWEISLEHALEGGLIGVGYGATVGETSFDGGPTAAGYGREKGNTQMAIIEETGLVGLGLYAVFLTVLFRRMFHSFRWVRTQDERVLLGILTGMLLGLTLQGIFEAWWVAPGSPEAAYWWAFVGAASGVSLYFERRARDDRRMSRAGKISTALSVSD